MLLSSVAEHLYWFGRYLERIENTARLVMVNDSRLLDSPPDCNPGWAPLLQITSRADTFHEHYDTANEQNVIHFLLMDNEHNPDSMLSSITMARENLRTTRAIFPNPIWEVINELHDFLKAEYAMAVTHNQRYPFLRKVIDYCHLVAGKIAATTNHDEIYEFLRIGCNLERADMTTRIIDVGVCNLLTQHKESTLPFEDIQWKSVLDSLAAWQMYRRSNRVQLDGSEVLNFLLNDKQFPRSVHYCLMQLEESLYSLGVKTIPRLSLKKTLGKIREIGNNKLSGESLHLFIDELQRGFNAIHKELDQCYFSSVYNAG